MTAVFSAAAELQAVCESNVWKYCFIGGVALQRWGEPRMTADADITLITGFGGEERFIHELLGHFESRVGTPVEFALRNRVLLLRAKSGVGLDVALGALPFEESSVARSSLFTFPGEVLLRTCSAEDLVVMKAFASRAKDWWDVEQILVRQTGQLDWSYIRRELKPLAEAKEEPEIFERLERLRIDSER
jgi:hypothetical protein